MTTEKILLLLCAIGTFIKTIVDDFQISDIILFSSLFMIFLFYSIYKCYCSTEKSDNNSDNDLVLNREREIFNNVKNLVYDESESEIVDFYSYFDIKILKEEFENLLKKKSDINKLKRIHKILSKGFGNILFRSEPLREFIYGTWWSEENIHRHRLDINHNNTLHYNSEKKSFQVSKEYLFFSKISDNVSNHFFYFNGEDRIYCYTFKFDNIKIFYKDQRYT